VARAWPLYAVLCASTCIVVGLLWDISWHSTVGRDTFWTLPHLLEQFGALLAGLSCGWLVLWTTFRGAPEQRAESVRFWGFLGPLGAWVTIWGTFVMITSAPFDNWWHNAYGLDVQIVSPPHMVLALGMVAHRNRRITLCAWGPKPRGRHVGNAPFGLDLRCSGRRPTLHDRDADQRVLELPQ